MFFADQRYRCQCCGRCCRRFLIPVSRLEIEAISRLPWPKSSESREKCYAVVGGRSYLNASPETGECLYLEPDGRCRMHATFGSKCKTISCRAFPFEFMRTFGDEITVAARFDCPAVLANTGDPLTHYRIELEDLLADPLMPKLPPPIAPAQMDGLSRAALEYIADFLAESLRKTAVSIPALERVCQRLRKLGPDFANDLETLKVVLPSMREKADRECPSSEEPVIGVLWPERVALRLRMMECLRGDRQKVADFALTARLRQCVRSARVALGGGNPSEYGPDQPDIDLRDAQLFDNRLCSSVVNAWEPYRRCLAVRLESRHFFASAYYGKGFYDGLAALFGTWKIAVLLARVNAAAARHPRLTTPEDVAYATGLIDHFHGRKVVCSS